MRHQNGYALSRQYIFHGWNNFFDSRCVGDFACLHRNVDIDAQKHFFTRYVHIIYGFPAHLFPAFFH